MMKLESAILILASLFSFLSIFFIPQSKSLQAQFVFLFVQLPTWVLGLSAVELRLLEYPYREISKINRTSFIFEFLVLPVICIHLNARFPQNASLRKKICIYIGISLLFTAIEVLLELYTDIIKYTGWKWYWTFLSIAFILWLSRKTTLWFFGDNKSS